VRDEVRMALDYYDASIFATIPVLYKEIASAFDAEFPTEDLLPAPYSLFPVVVRFGSWIGGDRDGNPFVTADTTADALNMARNLLLDHYLTQLRDLFDQLASSTHQAPLPFASGWTLTSRNCARPATHRSPTASPMRPCGCSWPASRSGWAAPHPPP
jgi:phosphoenolpyruvate carboxylase